MELSVIGGRERGMRMSAGLMLTCGTMALVVASCGDDCFGVASCIPDIAVVLSVSASPDGGPVGDATVRVSGAIDATVPCSIQASQTMCVVYGGAGTYVMELTAPGYVRVERTATVGNTMGHCGCGTVATRSMHIALQRSP
jgi:hypothetical protein